MQMALRRPISQVVKQLEAKVNLAGLGDTITPQAQPWLNWGAVLSKSRLRTSSPSSVELVEGVLLRLGLWALPHCPA